MVSLTLDPRWLDDESRRTCGTKGQYELSYSNVVAYGRTECQTRFFHSLYFRPVMWSVFKLPRFIFRTFFTVSWFCFTISFNVALVTMRLAQCFITLCLLTAVNYVLPGADAKEVDIYFGEEDPGSACQQRDQDEFLNNFDTDIHSARKPDQAIEEEVFLRSIRHSQEPDDTLSPRRRDILSRRSPYNDPRDEARSKKRRSQDLQEEEDEEREMLIRKLVRERSSSSSRDQCRRSVQDRYDSEPVEQEVTIRTSRKPSSPQRSKSKSPCARQEPSYERDEEQFEEEEEVIMRKVIKEPRGKSVSSQQERKERSVSTTGDKSQSPGKGKSSSPKEQGKNKKKGGKKDKSKY